jgi:hypothetical protein
MTDTNVSPDDTVQTESPDPQVGNPWDADPDDQTDPPAPPDPPPPPVDPWDA